METGRPVDVLPDREQATVEEWLRAHPGAEVICRDRAGAYAAAVRAAAPGAVQVADRWHLWDNLREHAGKAVARHRECVGSGSCACQAPARKNKSSRNRKRRNSSRKKTGVPAGLEAVVRERHAAVHGLRAAGKTQDQAAAALGLARQLTGRFWRAASAEALLKRAAPRPWTRTSLTCAGGGTGHHHHRGPAPGDHRLRLPRQRAHHLRLAGPAPARRPAEAARPARETARSPGGCSPTPPASAKTSRPSSPPSSAAAPNCTPWPATSPSSPRCSPAASAAASTAGSPPPASTPPLASFANGIRQDYQAVRNALTLEWNSGRVEGLNTRTKQLHRQMYGRASFPLLRKRILTS